MGGPSKVPQHSNYHSFLLRIWRTNPREDWRVSIEDTATLNIEVFRNLTLFINFLHRLAGQNPALDDEERNMNA